MSKSLTIVDETNKELVDLIKQQIARGATDLELRYFVSVCNRMGLDPFAKQIWAVKRYDSVSKMMVMGVQVGIDGLRSTANRSNQYRGQIGPWWCGKDGKWVDLWTDEEPPYAAKVGILKEGFTEPIYGIVKYKAVVGLTKEGKPNAFWAKMPDHMLAKCAEALAIRKAFPTETAGAFLEEESENEPEPEVIGPSKRDYAKMDLIKAKIEDIKTSALAETSQQDEQQQSGNDEVKQEQVVHPIVNHAPQSPKSVDEYRTNFAFGNYKSGLAFIDLGVQETKKLQTLVKAYCLKLKDSGKEIPNQLLVFIDYSESYLERFK